MLRTKGKSGAKCSTCTERLTEDSLVEICFECKLIMCANCFDKAIEKEQDTR